MSHSVQELATRPPLAAVVLEVPANVLLVGAEVDGVLELALEAIAPPAVHEVPADLNVLS